MSEDKIIIKCNWIKRKDSVAFFYAAIKLLITGEVYMSWEAKDVLVTDEMLQMLNG